MALRTIKFIVALTLAVSVGVILSVVTDVGAQSTSAPETADQPASSSPSQEARERINELRRNEFFYQSFGRNDPYRSLIGGEFEAAFANDVVDLNSAKLVGVMWGSDDRFALVEDGAGFGYILRVGDRVRNGRIVSIRKNALSARLSLYGISNTVVLKLDKMEG